MAANRIRAKPRSAQSAPTPSAVEKAATAKQDYEQYDNEQRLSIHGFNVRVVIGPRYGVESLGSSRGARVCPIPGVGKVGDFPDGQFDRIGGYLVSESWLIAGAFSLLDEGSNIGRRANQRSGICTQ
jgi:hypothetical protein